MNNQNAVELELRAMFERRLEDIDTTYVIPGRVRRRIKMMRLTYAGIGLALILALGSTAVTLISSTDVPGERTVAPAAPGDGEALQEVDGMAPTSDELVGTWTNTGGPGAVRFRRDGTVQISDSLVGLGSSPVSGTYVLEGNRVTFSGGCLEGQVWELGLILGYNPYEDALDVSFIEGRCGSERGTFWETQRVKT